MLIDSADLYSFLHPSVVHSRNNGSQGRDSMVCVVLYYAFLSGFLAFVRFFPSPRRGPEHKDTGSLMMDNSTLLNAGHFFLFLFPSRLILPKNSAYS